MNDYKEHVVEYIEYGKYIGDNLNNSIEYYEYNAENYKQRQILENRDKIIDDLSDE